MKRLLLLGLMACAEPTKPPALIVTCEPVVIGGMAVPGDSVCSWLDPSTGHGGPGRHP